MIITSTRVRESQRAEQAGKLFGVRFLWIESYAFDTASSLSPEYDGGTWTFYAASNGAFFMTPTARDTFTVECANGFSGTLSAEAFGITCCLHAYSLLSFSPDERFAQTCAEQFHQLRELALEHLEATAIIRACD